MTLLTPEFLDTKTYAASKLRDVFGSLCMGEGVTDPRMSAGYAGNLAVTQRGAGANMSVDVAVGAAWVRGDDVARQGLYRLVNDATVNVSVGTAHGSNPRVDQIILRVYDSSVTGSSDVPVIQCLAGTATAGATLDNRTGATALPNGAIRLADVLVPASDTTITNDQIRDRRVPAAGAAFVSHPTSRAITGTTYQHASPSTPERDAVRLVVPYDGCPVRLFGYMLAKTATQAGYIAVFTRNLATMTETQLKSMTGNGVPAVAERDLGATTDDFFGWFSPSGQVWAYGGAQSGSSDSSSVTTGFASAGEGQIIVHGLPAGEYEFSTQYKVTSGGTFTRKELVFGAHLVAPAAW